jgi:hypothetical protein
MTTKKKKKKKVVQATDYINTLQTLTKNDNSLCTTSKSCSTNPQDLLLAESLTSNN